MRYRMLTRNNEFSRAYARGASFVHPLLVLYVNKNRCGRLRIGLTATKKVGNAVQRNRARRVLRAALDAVLPQEAATARGKGVDLVLVARAATPKRKSQDVAAALEKLMRGAGLPCRTAEKSAAAAALPTAPNKVQDKPQPKPQDKPAQGAAAALTAQTAPCRQKETP